MVELNTKRLISISIGGRYTRIPFAGLVQGLIDLCEYIDHNSDVPIGQMQMAEIGCFTGEGSEIFAQYFDKVHCVDIWSKDFYIESDWNNKEVFHWRMDRFGKEKYQAWHMPSLLAVNHFPNGSLDFVYVDAMHWYQDVLDDCKAWMPKVKKGGFIGGHDFIVEWQHPEGPGVIQAITELFGQPDKTFQDWSWIKKL